MSSELERALESATAVPAAVTRAARDALGHRAAGVLAPLTADVDEGSGEARRRRLTWGAEGVEIHADVVPGRGRSCALRCRVVGADVVAAYVELPATTEQCALADDSFAVDDVAAGPVRLLVDVADGDASRRIHTDWVTV